VGADGPGDGQILKFTRFGKFELQIGHKGGLSKGSNDVENLNGAQQIAVDPATNEVFVADGLKNHRVIVFDGTTGQYKRHWGAYGTKPDDAAVPAKYDPAVRSKQFGEVHGIALSRDGLVYVCDRTNDRVQVFRKDGTFVKEGLVAPKTLGGSAYEIAFSADPGQQYGLVVDGMNEKVWILWRDTLETIGSFGDGGHNGRRVRRGPQHRDGFEGQHLRRRNVGEQARPTLLVQGNSIRNRMGRLLRLATTSRRVSR